MKRLGGFVLAIGAGACGTSPSTSGPAVDASVPVVDAGDAGADASREILPYPPGPYGGGVGDVLPDFRVQGFALSRTERDSTKLPFREISMAEVRSDPSCKCVVVVQNAVGNQCGFCTNMDRMLTVLMAQEPDICGLEVGAINFDGLGAPDAPPLDHQRNHPPTRADLEDFTQAGRESYPVGLLTESANRALTTWAFSSWPSFYVVRARDMLVLSLNVGVRADLRSYVRTMCDRGPLNPIETLASGLTPRRLAIDASNVYVSDRAQGILRVPLTGGAPATIARPSSSPDAIAIDSTYVYWATHDGGASFEIGRAPLAGGATNVLTSGPSGYLGIAVDATDVYFTRADNVVGSVPIGGGVVTTIATGEAGPTSIVADATTIYWVESGTRSLVAATKGGGARRVLSDISMSASTGLVFDSVPGVIATNAFEVLVGLRSASGVFGGYVRVSKVTGQPIPVGLEQISALAVDPLGPLAASSHSFTEGAGVIDLGKANLLTAGQRYVRSLAGDGTYVYWTTNEDESALGTGALRRMRRLTPKDLSP